MYVANTVSIVLWLCRKEEDIMDSMCLIANRVAGTLPWIILAEREMYTYVYIYMRRQGEVSYWCFEECHSEAILR